MLYLYVITRLTLHHPLRGALVSICIIAMSLVYCIKRNKFSDRSVRNVTSLPCKTNQQTNMGVFREVALAITLPKKLIQKITKTMVNIFFLKSWKVLKLASTRPSPTLIIKRYKSFHFVSNCFLSHHHCCLQLLMLWTVVKRGKGGRESGGAHSGLYFLKVREVCIFTISKVQTILRAKRILNNIHIFHIIYALLLSSLKRKY